MVRRVLAACLLVGAAGPDARADPPARPSLEERLRILGSHARPPVRWQPAPAPATGQEDFDVVNYDLTIALSVWERRIEGIAVVSFVPAPGIAELRELVLDLAGNLTIAADAVTRRSVPGMAVPFHREGDVLRIDLAGGGGPLPAGISEAVTIKYGGFPRQDGEVGLQFSTFGQFPDHVPSVFSLSQPNLARTWWPCKDRPDDKATVTMRIDAPQQWTAVSNGVPMGISPSSRDGNVITGWRERVPIPTYLVSLALSAYETCTAEYVSPLDPSIVTPLTHWAWPSEIDRACSRWQSTPDMMAAFAERFGEYPFWAEKHDTVAVSPKPRTNPFVAMENATTTLIGAGWLPLQHETLLAHELAHHWFGNSVTPRDFSSLWLNEGFATYAEALWWESRYGHAQYRGYLRDLDMLRVSGEFVGPVDDPIDSDGDGWPDGNASGPELTVYYKGAWILHMLRWVIGQADQGVSVGNVSRVLRDWADAHARGTATTDDFVAMTDVLATDAFDQRDGLRWFFDQWLHRDDRPCYRVGWTSLPGMDGGFTLQLVVDQAKWGLDEDTGAMTCAEPLPAPYRMPVAVRVDLEGGERMMLAVDSRQMRDFWSFDLPARPLAVTWDPDGWILKAVQAVDVDADGDSWADPFDTCPFVPDPEQRDSDGDGVGDACQEGLDFDGDGVPNELDCAPADPGAWTGVEHLPPIEITVAKGMDGLVVRHGMPEPPGGGERPHVLDIAQGRLERLAVNRSFQDAACVEAGRTEPGGIVIPWTSLGGNRYVVLLPYNGCGQVGPSGQLDDPCR